MSTRSKHLSIRFTPDEKDLISRAAQGENRKPADWARLLILARCEEVFREQDKEEQEAS